jgi:VanZ family protein
MTRWLPPAAWLGLVACLTLTPRPAPAILESLPQLLGLAGHFILFGVLTLLLLRARAPTSRPAPVLLGLTLPLLVAGAGLDEWAQSHIPARTSSLADLAADVVGITLFAALWRRGTARPDV